MNIETRKQDTANAFASGVIEHALIQTQFAKLVNKAAKTLKVDGFRKGKVPPHVIKARFEGQLMQDSEQDLVKEFVALALKDLEVQHNQLLGTPLFLKYDKDEKGIALEVRFALRPEVDLSRVAQAVPDFEKPSVEESEIQERLQNLSKSHGVLKDVQRDVRDGDVVVIDFEGFIDGEAFEGGKAERYSLEIGSGAFIPGFEEQLVGMCIDDAKDISVRFPKEYGAAHLADKEAIFKIKLHEIKERESLAIDDDLAKKILQGEENPSLDILKERVQSQLLHEKKMKLYNDELKQKLAEKLVDVCEFDVPENIVEQEMDILFRNEVNGLPQDELEFLQGKEEEVRERREKHREDARKSVKMTLIIDSLAKEKKIGVSEQEVWQRLYIEAVSLRQDPKVLLEYYQKNGILPAFQMAILEDKVLTSLLDENTKTERES